jgi:hypothetical protein
MVSITRFGRCSARLAIRGSSGEEEPAGMARWLATGAAAEELPAPRSPNPAGVAVSTTTSVSASATAAARLVVQRARSRGIKRVI